MSKTVFQELARDVRLTDIDFSIGCIKDSARHHDKQFIGDMPSHLASSLSNCSSKNRKMKDNRTDSYNSNYKSSNNTANKVNELSFTEEMNNTDISEIGKIKNEIELSSIDLKLDLKSNDSGANSNKFKHNQYNLKMDDTNVYNIHK